MSGANNSDVANPIDETYRSEMLQDGRRFLLPHRRLGTITKYAGYFVVLGVVMATLLFFFSVLPMLSVINDLIVDALGAGGMNVNFDGILFAVFRIVIGGFASIGFYFVVKFTLFALAIRNGKTKCEVTVRETHIAHRETFYGFRFKLKQTIAEVDAIYLNPLISQEKRDSADGQDAYEFLPRLIGEDTCALAFKKRKPVPIAFGYTMDILEPIANEIRTELMRRQPNGRKDLQIVKRTAYQPMSDDRKIDSHDEGSQADS